MKLSSVDLNLLLVLHAVLEERSVTRAARRLHVTPPAISNSLARLRDVLGDPLLVRSGRGLTPTPRALDLAPELAAALQKLEHLVAGSARFDPATATRTFTVACTDVDQLAYMPVVARAFTARLPRATLQIVSVDTLEALGGIERAEVDAVLAPAPPAPSPGAPPRGALPRGAPLPSSQGAPPQGTSPPGIHSTPLYEDEAVLVLRRGHPAFRNKLTRRGFNSLRHVDLRISLGEPGIGHRMAEAFFAEHGLTRDVAVTAPSFAAALMLAASTDLAAGVPRRIAEAFAPSLPIQIARIPAPPMRFAIHLHWHERTHRDEGSRYFRSLLSEPASPSGSSRR